MDPRMRVCMCFACSCLVVLTSLAVLVSAPHNEPERKLSSILAGKKLPDLVPLYITTTPASPVNGQSATISSQVGNVGGTTTATFYNFIYVDGIGKGYQVLSGLKGGSSGPVWSANVTLGPGYHLLEAEADVTDNVRESDEGNNLIANTMWWAAPDLVVSSLEIYQFGVSATKVVSAEPFDLEVTVQNVGDALAVTSVLEVYDIMNGTSVVMKSVPVGNLDPNGTADFLFQGLFLNDTGEHVIRAVADCNEWVQEANKATGSGVGTGELNNAKEIDVPVTLEWLVMGYIAYEGMLESTTFDIVIWFLGKIWNTTVNHSDSVRVILLVDRRVNWEGTNNSNARIYELADNTYSMISDLGELNMGEANTLSDFIIWATTTYPAEKRLLWMYDHGDGWLGTCQDIVFDPVTGSWVMDQLNMTELKTALSTAYASIGSKVDVLAWYACMMGNLEVAYQLKDYVEVMVGCEQSDGVPAWITFRYLIENPSCNATELAERLVYDYYTPTTGWDWHHGGRQVQAEVAAIDLTRLEGLVDSLEIFAQHLSDSLTEYRADIVSCRNEAMSFGHGNFVDLYHFVELIDQSGFPKDQTMSDAIHQIKDGVEDAVFCLFHTDDEFVNTHGLTIGLPTWFLYNREYGILEISQDSAAPSWSEFLKRYCGCYAPPYELYAGAEDWCNSSIVGSGEYHYQVLNEFAPQANLTTGDAGVALEVATGSSCPSGLPEAGEATFTGYAGFRGIEVVQVYDTTVLLSCSWNGTYSAAIAADMGAEASFSISVHAEIRHVWNGELVPGGESSIVIDSGTVSDGETLEFWGRSFSVSVELVVDFEDMWDYELVTYIKVEARANSTSTGSDNGAFARVDLAPDTGSPYESARCSCMRLIPVLFQDDFTDGTMNPWTATGNYTIVTDIESHTPEYSLYVEYYVSTGTGTQRATTPSMGVDVSLEYTVEFWYMTPFGGASRTAARMYVFDDGRVRILQQGANLVAETPYGNVTIGFIELYEWHKIRLVVDPESSAYTVYLNGQYSGTYEFFAQGTEDTFTVGSPVDPAGRIAGRAYWDDFIVIGYPCRRTTFVLNLAEGWNLVTVPLVNHGYNASTLGLADGDIVSRWDAMTQSYDKEYVVGESDPSEDFALEPSTGYWICVNSTATLVLYGHEASQTQFRAIDVPEGGGWVYVGLASLDTTFWASELIEMFSGNITVVTAWDPAEQEWGDYYIVQFPETDFPLVPGEGLLVHCLDDGVLSYDP